MSGKVTNDKLTYLVTQVKESPDPETRETILLWLRDMVELYLEQTIEEVNKREQQREEWYINNPPTNETQKALRECNRERVNARRKWQENERKAKVGEAKSTPFEVGVMNSHLVKLMGEIAGGEVGSVPPEVGIKVGNMWAQGTDIYEAIETVNSPELNAELARRQVDELHNPLGLTYKWTKPPGWGVKPGWRNAYGYDPWEDLKPLKPLKPYCEFCSGTPVTARYDLIAPNDSRSDAAACAICETLIDAGEWDMVVERTVDTYYVKYPHATRPRSEATAMVTETWRLVRDVVGLRKGKL
jgi:hypothetical protein